MSAQPHAIGFDRFSAQGNVFCIVNAHDVLTPLDPDDIKRWAGPTHARFFDQLLVIDPIVDTEKPCPVAIYNADGSTAEQCGNGMRALAFWLMRLGGQAHHALQPPAGVVEILDIQADNNPIDRPTRAWVNVRLPGPQGQQHHDHWPNTPALAAVSLSLGNPHLVLQWPHPPSVDECFDVGARLQTHADFDGGVNVGLAHAPNPSHDHAIDLRVYERGVGPTQACGSGACAAASALAGLGAAQAPVTVAQPGGSLVVDWAGDASATRVVELAGDVDWIEQGQFQP